MIAKVNLTEKFKDYIISKDTTLKLALSHLATNPDKCLIVIDNKYKLLGSLTDGDIRRAILRGTKFNSPIKRFYNKQPVFIKYNSSKNLKSLITFKKLRKRYRVIPVIDNEKKILDLITSKNKILRYLNQSNIKFTNVPVVIMAGGRGTRLLPYTSVIPKPLVPIDNKSMIEHVLDKFYDYGLENFIISLNYKNELMKAFFSNTLKKFKINFIYENKPLGTAGSLSKAKSRLKRSFFVSNCDSIIKCDYSSLYNFHLDKNFDLTIVASQKSYNIPYGSCKLDSRGYLKKLKEKPTYNFLANTGLYVLKPKVLNFIPLNKALDMNELIDKLIKKKCKIGVFPVDKNDWLDFGDWKEFEKFTNKISEK